jgi:hypothetical protein
VEENEHFGCFLCFRGWLLFFHRLTMSMSKRARLSAATLRWSGRKHHVFYTIVLPTVFEWCALSDFFMPDEMFHAYPEEHNGRVTTRGPFLVAHAVCKDWFVVLYKRIMAHRLRADYDVRVLRSNTGGIVKGNHVMVWGWDAFLQQKYLERGGVPLAEEYQRGVELTLTVQHMLLFKKWHMFLHCRALHRLFESLTPGFTRLRASTMAQRAARKGRRRIEFRRSMQIVHCSVFDWMVNMPCDYSHRIFCKREDSRVQLMVDYYDEYEQQMK